MSYYGLYISAEGAHAQSRRVETLANNLANADTVGFKRDLAIFQARYAEETQQGLDYAGSRIDERHRRRRPRRGNQNRLLARHVQETGNRSDMAIGGEGFFMVRRPDGDLLTRRQFHV